MKRFHKYSISLILLIGFIATGIFGFNAIGAEQGCIAVISHGSPACMSSMTSDLTMFHIDSFFDFTTATLHALVLLAVLLVAFAYTQSILLSTGVYGSHLSADTILAKYYSLREKKYYLSLQFHAA